MKGMTLAVVGLAFVVAGCAPLPDRQQLRNQAVAQFQVGQTEQAKESLKRLLDYYPGDPDGLFYMGRVSQTENAFSKAIYYYQSCLDADPGYRPARLWLQKASQESGIPIKEPRYLP